MKRSLLTGLGLTLLASVQLIGCATDGTRTTSASPATSTAPTPSSGGKADALDYENDPRACRERLEYRLADAAEEGQARQAGVEGRSIPRRAAGHAGRVGRHLLADRARARTTSAGRARR